MRHRRREFVVFFSRWTAPVKQKRINWPILGRTEGQTPRRVRTIGTKPIASAWPRMKFKHDIAHQITHRPLSFSINGAPKFATKPNDSSWNPNLNKISTFLVFCTMIHVRWSRRWWHFEIFVLGLIDIVFKRECKIHFSPLNHTDRVLDFNAGKKRILKTELFENIKSKKIFQNHWPCKTHPRRNITSKTPNIKNWKIENFYKNLKKNEKFYRKFYKKWKIL